MKSHTIFILFLVFISSILALNAQPTSGNASSLGLKPEVKPRDFEEQLVAMAMANHPTLKVLQFTVAEAEAKMQSNRKRWANAISFNGGLLVTDSTRIIVNQNGQVALPGYNFGVGLQLGPFLQQKGVNKEYKAGVDIAQAKIQEAQLEMRQIVLSKYRAYTLAVEIFGTRLQALEVASTNKALINELFQANRAEFDELNTAEGAYFEALEKKQEAEAEVAMAKYMLEQVVGEKWEVIERMRANFKPRN